MQSHFFKTSAQTSIHARITRPPFGQEGKPLLLFLHYWGGTSRTWHKVISSSSSNALHLVYTHPTLSVDLRGWGQSTGPLREDNPDYSIKSMAEDVVSVLRQVQEDESISGLLTDGVILVGHSMGAKVALTALALLGNEARRKVTGLVLVAPAPPTALELPQEMKEQQKVAYQTEDSVRWIVQNVLASPDRATSEDVEMVVSDSLSGNYLAKAAWPSHGMAEDISHFLKALVESSAGYSIPVRVLVGEFDIVEPKKRVETEVVQLLNDLGVFQVSMAVVKSVKHLIPLEDPDSIVQEILKM